MNGYEIYKRAKMRMGIISSGEEIFADDGLTVRITEFINQIALDLKLAEISSLSQEINASKEKTEALLCGVVMLLALSEGDGEKNMIYTSLYNAKRTAALCEKSCVEDRLPNGEGGGA